MFGSFSSSAMTAIGRADQHASQRAASEISAADIAVAVLDHLANPVDGMLLELHAALVADATDAEPAHDRLLRSAFTDRIPDQQLPFSESAIATFRGAWKKAKWAGRPDVDEYDLLTAAIEQPALTIARAGAGIDLDSASALIKDLRQSEQP